MHVAPKEKCWIWFRNGYGQEVSSKGGWYGARSPKGGIRIGNFDFVPYRVPEWLVSWDEPIDKDMPPGIPEGADWKLFPTD